jgi:hypothetical protein
MVALGRLPDVKDHPSEGHSLGLRWFWGKLVQLGGLEPPTSGSTKLGSISNLLNLLVLSTP